MGKISRFAAQALERQLIDLGADPVEEFVEIRRRLPKRGKAAIFKAIRRGRR